MIPHLEYSCGNNSMWFLWESDPGHSTLCLRHKHANRYTIEPPGSYVNSLEINLNQSHLYCCFTRRAKMVCRLYRILNIVEGIFFKIQQSLFTKDSDSLGYMPCVYYYISIRICVHTQFLHYFIIKLDL